MMTRHPWPLFSFLAWVLLIEDPTASPPVARRTTAVSATAEACVAEGKSLLPFLRGRRVWCLEDRSIVLEREPDTAPLAAAEARSPAPPARMRSESAIGRPERQRGMDEAPRALWSWKEVRGADGHAVAGWTRHGSESRNLEECARLRNRVELGAVRQFITADNLGRTQTLPGGFSIMNADGVTISLRVVCLPAHEDPSR